MVVTHVSVDIEVDHIVIPGAPLQDVNRVARDRVASCDCRRVPREKE